MRDGHGRALVAAVLLAVLTGCGGEATGEPQASTTSATTSSSSDAAGTQFAYDAEGVAVEPGTYRIPSSSWSVADFRVTFPEGWTVQYGHVFAKHQDSEEFGFYAVLPDEIYAETCVGSGGELMEVGPTVDDLAAALLEQRGPKASGPVDTTLGGYPAIRIDLPVPEGFDLKPCNVKNIGLQIWYSRPATSTSCSWPMAWRACTSSTSTVSVRCS